jgi:hypothetical protein
MDINRRNLMKLLGVGSTGLMAGGKVLAEEPDACDGLSDVLGREYPLAGAKLDVSNRPRPKNFGVWQHVTRYFGHGEDEIEKDSFYSMFHYLGLDEGKEMYQCSHAGKLIKRGRGYPSLTKMTYAYNGDMDAVEKFGVPVGNFMDMERSGEKVDVSEAYQVYQFFLRFHEMNNFLLEGFYFEREVSIPYLDRVGQSLYHQSHHAILPLSFGDELGEDSYVKNGAVNLKFLGLGKGVNREEVGVVGLSVERGESHLQFDNAPGGTYDRLLLLREGTINVNLETQLVNSFIDKEVSSIHYSPSGRSPGSRYTEVKETHFKGIASGGDLGV